MATITQRHELGSYVPSINLGPYDLEEMRIILEFYKDNAPKSERPNSTFFFACKLRKQLI